MPGAEWRCVGAWVSSIIGAMRGLCVLDYTLTKSMAREGEKTIYAREVYKIDVKMWEADYYYMQTNLILAFNLCNLNMVALKAVQIHYNP